MSFAPQSLLDARDYIQDQTGLPVVSLGIVGDEDHRAGYHLGRDRIFGPDGAGDDDYSVQTARDRTGLTDAASALDVGSFSRLRQLTAHMVAEARTGQLNDLREIIGPGSDGRAYRWDDRTGWVAARRAEGDSHEFHVHFSYYRDSQQRSKLEPFRTFFEPEGEDVTPQDAEMFIDRLLARRFSSPALGIDQRPIQDWLKGGHAADQEVMRARAQITELRGLLAGLVGEDVAAVVRTTIREEFALLGPALAEQLDGVTTEQVEQAIRAVFGSVDE